MRLVCLIKVEESLDSWARHESSFWHQKIKAQASEATKIEQEGAGMRIQVF